jgi:hypothetical protein
VCQIDVGLAIGFHLGRLKSFWVDLKILYQRSILCASDNKAMVLLPTHREGNYGERLCRLPQDSRFRGCPPKLEFVTLITFAKGALIFSASITLWQT